MAEGILLTRKLSQQFYINSDMINVLLDCQSLRMLLKYVLVGIA